MTYEVNRNTTKNHQKIKSFHPPALPYANWLVNGAERALVELLLVVRDRALQALQEAAAARLQAPRRAAAAGRVANAWLQALRLVANGFRLQGSGFRR